MTYPENSELEPDDHCRECGQVLVEDDSPGVLLHLDSNGNIDYARDRDHVGIPEIQP